jgi:hypothetical protein
VAGFMDGGRTTAGGVSDDEEAETAGVTGGGVAAHSPEGVGVSIRVGAVATFSFFSSVDDVDAIGKILPLAVIGRTTVMAGGVFENGRASREVEVAGRIMPLDLLAELAGNGGADGDIAGVTAAGMGGLANDGVGAGLATGGWKSRADLRRMGSIGGVIVFDFLGAGGISGPGAGVTSAGGRMMEDDLRVSGSTGGMIGADFFTAGMTGGTEVSGRFPCCGTGVGGSDGVSMAAVLEGGSGMGGGLWDTGETRPATGAGTGAVRRDSGVEGGR